MLEVRISRDGSYFTLRGISTGEAQVEVSFADDTSHIFTVLVSDEVAGLSGEVTIQPGESHTLSADGVQRVLTDHENIVDIALSEDGQTIFIEGTIVGEALVYLYGADQDVPKAYRVQVAAQ